MAERLRSAAPGDVTALAAIDAVCNPSPWSESAFAETLPRAIALVVEDDAQVVTGFVMVTVAADECEVLGLAVMPDRRRAGIGRTLLEEALSRAAQRGARRCHLEVRASNRAARSLYAKCGFAMDGRRRDYYRDRTGAREDALLLSLELDGALA
jgi:ribosomal-protein-alanine N-acetyltransferase